MQHRRNINEWVSDLAAKALAITCAFNLNGVANMAFDVGQSVSFVMLTTSLILIILRGKAAWSTPMVLLVAAIMSYLLLATIFYDPFATIYPPTKFYQAYGGGILILWAVAAYTASLASGLQLGTWLAFLRNVFLISAASVWASPVLYQYYVNLPLSSEQRMGGFFGNPNEAAMASLLAFALLLTVPFRRRLIQFSLLFMAAGAVILTFSKTGISALLIILAWHTVHRAKGIRLALTLAGTLFAVIAIQDINSVLEAVVENPVLEFDASQKRRILAVGDILSGRINKETSTGRTYLWGLVLERAWERFPLGDGLGSAHHIIGGIFENGVWMGAHNTFLMLFSEAGPLPAGLLIAAIILLAIGAKRNGGGKVELFCLFLLVIDMIATHGALATRYHNLMLGMVLGLVANRGLMVGSSVVRAPGDTFPQCVNMAVGQVK